MIVEGIGNEVVYAFAAIAFIAVCGVLYALGSNSAGHATVTSLHVDPLVMGGGVLGALCRL